MNGYTASPSIAALRRFRVPTRRALAYWVVSAPILLETIDGSEWDLARISYVREVFGHLGYPPYLLTILGVAKLLAVAALLVPGFRRIREWAYAGVFFVYAGAACSHFAVGDGPDKVLTPLVFAVLTVISSTLRAADSSNGKAVAGD
jgi:uncharacterized membrane protein YphA (DoxX/SURF4 family)